MNPLVVTNSSSAPTEHELMVYQTMAEQAVDSKMYRGIGDKSAVMMIMLSARELGIPPFQALNGGIHIIEGKAEISARMMSALIRKAGHSIQIKKSTDDECILVGKRIDNDDTETVSYTIQDAQRAGLIKEKGGWKKNPKDMCFARALSRLGRQLFSDVIGIGYVEGEIRATDHEPIIPDDLPSIENKEQTIDITPDLHKRYLEIFDEEDRHIANEYLNVVQAHFQWTKLQTLSELLKDEKRLLDKFTTWKNKTKQGEI